MENCNCTVSYTRPCEGCPNAPKPFDRYEFLRDAGNKILEDLKHDTEFYENNNNRWSSIIMSPIARKMQRYKNYKASLEIERMCNRGN